jgi:hypothetical protein
MQGKEIDLTNELILIKKESIKVDEYRYKKRIYKRDDYPGN